MVVNNDSGASTERGLERSRTATFRTSNRAPHTLRNQITVGRKVLVNPGSNRPKSRQTNSNRLHRTKSLPVLADSRDLPKPNFSDKPPTSRIQGSAAPRRSINRGNLLPERLLNHSPETS